jgi:hypothetical protein
MSATGILPFLKPATVRGAAEHSEPLTMRTLRRKMEGRAKQGWYITAGADGTFSRGVFPTLGRRKRAAPAGVGPG